MSALDHLLKYVRTGTAEGDRSFLGQIFIAPTQFSQLCAIEPGGMRVLVGNKGVGKSAVVEWIDKVAKEKKLPCLLIRPDNISSKEMPTSPDIGSLKRYYYEVLLRTVGAQIGAQLKGMLKGDSAKLHNEARQQGLTEDDFIQKSLELISAISLPVAKINGTQLAKELAGTNSPNALIKAINSQLLSSSNVFFLLIDDTDQLAAPDQPAHLNRIWALLLAVRRLTGECSAVRAIVSLRSSVWTRLTSESQGQRDQTDHMRGLVIPLLVDDTQMQNIVRKRMEMASWDAKKKHCDPYPIFFNGTTVTLPSSSETRTWDTFILKSARERPRDAIQLIKNMVDVAQQGNSSLIGSKEADSAMKVYSSERVDDVANEFSLDCKSIREIINTFADVNFESDFEGLRQHLLTIPSISSIQIRGTVLRPGVDDDAIAILRLLHETGFINPRVVDNTKPRGFRHILFHDDSNFVKLANWNSMQGARWEIHPAFRTYLIGVKQAQLAKLSPTKQPRGPTV
ncbi:AAA ATPase domain protein [Chromobacterium violaceum]|uniref:P-loop ATPase, Sll1717 family n=1 Tax=Chromobacterium violaceum TaxID=536 RepID=UPI003CEB2421